MIALLDYGSGNIRSVEKALRKAGADVQISQNPKILKQARGAVLPGVGAFDDCITAMGKQELSEAVKTFIQSGRPFLGICVGMQWLFEGSTESPETPGAGLFRGQCDRFPANVKSTHVGWNRLELIGDSSLLRGVPDGSFLYYTHSYRAPLTEDTVAGTSYGGRFSAAVERDNIFGTQFHPEKSGDAGLRILENFCNL